GDEDALVRSPGFPRLVSLMREVGPIVLVSHGQTIFEDCIFQAEDGCGILVLDDAEPVVRRCVFEQCPQAVHISGRAQGIFEQCQICGMESRGVLITDQADPTFRKCVISDCRREGVVIAGGAHGIFLFCEIHDNRSANVVLVDQADPTFGNCQIRASREHGVVVTKRSKGRFEDCRIDENRSFGVLIDDRSKPVFQRCRIVGNWRMGVVCDHESAPILERCTVERNRSSNFGIAHESKPILRECEFLDGVDEGVYITSCGYGTFERCRFERNRTCQVRVLQEGNPIFRMCRMSGGEKVGVHIMDFGHAELEDCEIVGSGSVGLLLTNEARGALRRVTIRGGLANAGILVRDHSRLTCERCQIGGHQPFSVGVSGKSDLECTDCELEGRVLISESETTASGVFRGCRFRPEGIADPKLATIAMESGATVTVAQCEFLDGIGRKRSPDILVHPEASLNESGNTAFRTTMIGQRKNPGTSIREDCQNEDLPEKRNGMCDGESGDERENQRKWESERKEGDGPDREDERNGKTEERGIGRPRKLRIRRPVRSRGPRAWWVVIFLAVVTALYVFRKK
ncbi:MAG: right-handed parallel beta-helix repeat-containing protein, partial [Planctomycetia bacterium]|nr:right-handed parallel beta-helix repeat-containing protein [Planctomycetia bacterium]